jgi:adenylate kinase family enzyme
MPDHCHIQPGHRIIVVGTSGSGKTYVAKRLAEVLGLTYICSDAIIWRANWIQTELAEQVEEYDQATRANSWAIDRNVGSLKAPNDLMILDRADTLVWLDLPRLEAYRQVLLRTIRRAWTQEPMWHGNCESWRLSFFSRDSILLWAVKTYAQRRREYAAIFADPDFAHLKKVRLASRRQVNAWLASLDGAIP